MAANTKTKKPSNTKLLPQYKVILHNDPVNTADGVVNRIVELTHMEKLAAQEKMVEAHKTGVALLLITHKERAELYVEQFAAYTPPITVTMEPA